MILGTISTKQKNEQVLDKLQVERERGITVKAQTASLIYEHKGEKYLLNLVDTPVSTSCILVMCVYTLCNTMGFTKVFCSLIFLGNLCLICVTFCLHVFFQQVSQ